MAIKVSWPDIVKLLQQGEGPTLEFIPKIKNSKDLTKVVIGFANAQGGIVVAGIDDKNGHLIGVDHDKDWAMQVCKTECEPAVSVQAGEMLRNQKRILVLQVKEGVNKPYRTIDGSVLTREGAETRQASAEEQKKLNPWGVGGLNPRQKKAMQYVSENGSISNMQYREINEVSHKTAHIELTELVEKGVIRVEGQGRSTCYVLDANSDTSQASGDAVASEEQALPTNGQLFSFEETGESQELPKVTRPKPAAKRTAAAKKVAMARAAEAVKEEEESVPAKAADDMDEVEEVPAYIRNNDVDDEFEAEDASDEASASAVSEDINEDEAEERPVLNVKKAPSSEYMDDEDDVSKASFLEI